MSDKYGNIKIKTTDGKTLIGSSWGINPCFDDDGNERNYNCLSFKLKDGRYIELKNEDIKSIIKL